MQNAVNNKRGRGGEAWRAEEARCVKIEVSVVDIVVYWGNHGRGTSRKSLRIVGWWSFR